MKLWVHFVGSSSHLWFCMTYTHIKYNHWPLQSLKNLLWIKKTDSLDSPINLCHIHVSLSCEFSCLLQSQASTMLPARSPWQWCRRAPHCQEFLKHLGRPYLSPIHLEGEVPPWRQNSHTNDNIPRAVQRAPLLLPPLQQRPLVVVVVDLVVLVKWVLLFTWSRVSAGPPH